MESFLFVRIFHSFLRLYILQETKNNLQYVI